MPIQRRLPKRGFKNPGRVEYQVVQVGRLAAAPAQTVVDRAVARGAEDRAWPRAGEAAGRREARGGAHGPCGRRERGRSPRGRGRRRHRGDAQAEGRGLGAPREHDREASQHLPGPRAEASDPVHDGAARGSTGWASTCPRRASTWPP